LAHFSQKTHIDILHFELSERLNMATKNKKQKRRLDRREKDKKLAWDCGDYCDATAAQICGECLEWSRYHQTMIGDNETKGGR
jgi:hypothetical protein